MILELSPWLLLLAAVALAVWINQKRYRLLADDLKKTQSQLMQVAKMESVGRLAAGVAHEVKNPLAIIQMGIDVLKMKCNGDTTPILQDMASAVVRADRVIRGLLDFSSADTITTHPCQINDLVEMSLHLVKHEITKNRIQVSLELSPSLPAVHLDKNKIHQVFINLLMNAIQAIGTEGQLTIRSYLKDKTIFVEFNDTGSGIAEDKIQKIYDPFFTTKPVGKGTGLGLTVSKRIIELHQGSILLCNREGGGVSAKIGFKIEERVKSTTPAERGAFPIPSSAGL